MPTLVAAKRSPRLGADYQRLAAPGKPRKVAIGHLPRLKHLQILSIRDTRITDVGLALLAQLPELKEVYVGGTAITPAGRAAFNKALPGCALKE